MLRETSQLKVRLFICMYYNNNLENVNSIWIYGKQNENLYDNKTKLQTTNEINFKITTKSKTSHLFKIFQSLI